MLGWAVSSAWRVGGGGESGWGRGESGSIIEGGLAGGELAHNSFSAVGAKGRLYINSSGKPSSNKLSCSNTEEWLEGEIISAKDFFTP
jgi:hypothetical protein